MSTELTKDSQEEEAEEEDMSGLNESVVKLVHEMGFNRAEVIMALRDTSGDVDKAVDKLLRGEYAPPPYTASSNDGAHKVEHNFSLGGKNEMAAVSYTNESQESKQLYPDMSNLFSGLLNRGKAPEFTPENPTAPSLFVDLSNSSDLNESMGKIDALPPPYQKYEKETKIKDWEHDMNVVYVNPELGDGGKDKNLRFSIASRDERCPVCFNAAVTATGANSSGEIVCHKGQVFHHACFTKKHGPKCAHCCFPLAQVDKDHELSGKYLVYNNKDYHVECYEKYAGPRCSSCFNVIIEKPNGEFSGQCVVDKNQQFHLECMQKKMHSAWRVKNS